MFPPGPSCLWREKLCENLHSVLHFIFLFLHRDTHTSSETVHICFLQFFMSVLLFDSLQSGIYPHSCHSQVQWAFSRCHFIWPVEGIALGTTPSVLKHLFLWLPRVHILLIFSPPSPADSSQLLLEAPSLTHPLNVGVLQGFDLGLPFFTLHTDDGLFYSLPWPQLASICR